MSFSEYFNETHNQVRASVRKMVQEKILPYVDEWEEAGTFPRELYEEAGRTGFLALGYPEALGGVAEGDVFMKVAATEELMRCGSGGLVASLGSLDIGLPPIVKWGSDELKEGWCPRCCVGKRLQPWRSLNPMVVPMWPISKPVL
jgi:acyl-CoA dehydrogenase